MEKIRLVALFLAIVMLTAVFASCEAEEPEVVPEWSDAEQVVSFGGAKFHIVDSPRNGETYLLMPDTTQVLSDNSERFLARVDKIESDYDCEIEVAQGDAASFMQNYAAGLRYGDILNLRLYNTYNLWRDGYILDLNDLPTIELHSGKYGSDGILSALTWKDDTVAFYANWWGLITPCFSDGLMYNPRILQEYGLPDPNELHEQGKWNWQALREMGDAVSQSPSGDEHIYLSNLNNYFARMLFLSNGARYVEEKNGVYTYAADSIAAIEAMDFCRELDSLGYLAAGTDVTTVLTKFVEGRLLMVAEYSVQGIMADAGVVGEEMEEAYYWTYAPTGYRGDSNEYGVISHENQFMAATVAVEDYDMFGTFMELFFDKLYDTEDGWRQSYASMNFFNTASSDCFFTKYDNAIFDNVVFMYQNDTLFNGILQAGKKDKNPTEVLQSFKDVAQSELDKALNN